MLVYRGKRKGISGSTASPGPTAGSVAAVAFDSIAFSSCRNAVTGTAVQPTKVYDGTTDATLTANGTLSGVETADTGKVAIATATATYGDKNVGTGKSIVVTYTLSGDEASNYTVADTTTLTANITPKAVVVTAEDKSMKLGEVLPELTAKAEGLVGSDTVDYGFSKIDVTGVGIYGIVPVGDAEQGNYAVSYVDGTLTVSAAEKPEGDKPAPAVDTDALKKIHDQYAADPQLAGKQLDVVLRTDGEVDAKDKALIEVQIGEQKAEFIDAGLFLIVKEEGKATETKNIGGENATLISMVYKFDFAKKTDIHVLRVHEGAAEELTETPNAAGEYVKFDKDAGTITIVACKYSTYAISYTDVVDPTPTPTPTPATGDNAGAHIALSVLAMFGAAGAALAARRRRSE